MRAVHLCLEPEIAGRANVCLLPVTLLLMVTRLLYVTCNDNIDVYFCLAPRTIRLFSDRNVIDPDTPLFFARTSGLINVSVTGTIAAQCQTSLNVKSKYFIRTNYVRQFDVVLAMAESISIFVGN